MRTSVIVFPGSNCDRDVKVAIERVTRQPVKMVWHGDSAVPASDLIVLPGGFSYGDYLRCGAMAAHSAVMRDVIAKARAGVPVLGICNGFQILTEAGLLPGLLMRNAGLRFVCREVRLRVENDRTFFTNRLRRGDVLRCPIAHGEGNYICDDETLNRLEAEGRVVFRYAEASNPNGAMHDIAGIVNETGNVIGMMPHPENMIEPLHGATDCRPLFESLLAA